jgi:alpha-1,3-glucosyltransferase
MLGFTLWAINCFLTKHFVLGSFFFCLSLGFKQMALYYAPAIFAFLLGRCFTERNGYDSTCCLIGPRLNGYYSIVLFIKLGVTVLATFGLMFSPWLSSMEDIQQVFIRIFPVARGLYEDKVANVWCAINVIVKLRQILTVESTVRLRLVIIQE